MLNPQCLLCLVFLQLLFFFRVKFSVFHLSGRRRELADCPQISQVPASDQCQYLDTNKNTNLDTNKNKFKFIYKYKNFYRNQTRERDKVCLDEKKLLAPSYDFKHKDEINSEHGRYHMKSFSPQKKTKAFGDKIAVLF